MEKWLCHDITWIIWANLHLRIYAIAGVPIVHKLRTVCYAIHKDEFVSSDADSLVWYFDFVRRRKLDFVMILPILSVV